jgi:hypothetical protein
LPHWYARRSGLADKTRLGVPLRTGVEGRDWPAFRFKGMFDKAACHLGPAVLSEPKRKAAYEGVGTREKAPASLNMPGS